MLFWFLIPTIIILTIYVGRVLIEKVQLSSWMLRCSICLPELGEFSFSDGCQWKVNHIKLQMKSYVYLKCNFVKDIWRRAFKKKGNRINIPVSLTVWNWLNKTLKYV